MELTAETPGSGVSVTAESEVVVDIVAPVVVEPVAAPLGGCPDPGD